MEAIKPTEEEHIDSKISYITAYFNEYKNEMFENDIENIPDCLEEEKMIVTQK